MQQFSSLFCSSQPVDSQPSEPTGDRPRVVRGIVKTGQNENPLDTHSQDSGNSGESFKATINEKYDYERYFIGYYRTEDTRYDTDVNEVVHVML